ncbi:hypothetical protein M0P48_00360 [Candidatus Gracilibacteria bacterium]|nr:hypothetical protein [Candidatus Gracilibacteria bacterium]
MNEQFKGYIEEYGGKHGPLLYFRERVPNGADLVPPMEIANLQDLVNRQIDRGIAGGVKTACRELGVNKFIARTSLKGFGDFDGLVDAMPTMRDFPVHLLDNPSYPGGVADSLMDECENPRLRRYAEKEGIKFDPANVTVSFSPQFDYPLSTITEHPNRPKITMVDVYKPLVDRGDTYEELNESVTGTMNYEGALPMRENESHFSSSRLENAMMIRRIVEEAGVLDHEDMAYQYEGASRKDKPDWLLQIRAFAPRRIADFTLGGYDPCIEEFGGRIMGITPKEGISLPHLQVEERDEAVRFEEHNPSLLYFLSLYPWGATPKLKLTEQLQNIRGYALPSKPALSHQNTRFAQACLRCDYGFVELGDSPRSFLFKLGDTLRIISDGITRVIERV